MSEITADLAARAEKIKLLLLDVDGVLTAGQLYFSNSGEELKAFHILDGLGIKQLQQSGVKVGIITGRESALVARRAGELSVEILVQKSPDKLQALRKIADQEGLTLDQVAFMGDDYPDLPPILAVGLGLTTANAHPEVSARCHWQSKRRGGDGAVREVCDLIMQAQGTYQAALEKYLG
ncbi:KdsC family phosphatase [Gilvimarinus sp. F26214L]|uniref:KdsC family phosphatase n=1 Tax=Gilvimarinus sp. DZF01 TaxID=3461371 RepID=UPI0040455C23